MTTPVPNTLQCTAIELRWRTAPSGERFPSKKQRTKTKTPRGGSRGIHSVQMFRPSSVRLRPTRNFQSTYMERKATALHTLASQLFSTQRFSQFFAPGYLTRFSAHFIPEGRSERNNISVGHFLFVSRWPYLPAICRRSQVTVMPMEWFSRAS